MQSSRGDVLNVLQWERNPRPGSLAFIQAKHEERRASLNKKDYVKDNIRRLRAIDVSGSRRSDNVREPVNPLAARIAVFDRYLADLESNPVQSTDCAEDFPDSQLKPRLQDALQTNSLSIKQRSRSSQGIQVETRGDAGKVDAVDDVVPSLKPPLLPPRLQGYSRGQESGRYLKAHEKTGSLETMMALSELPLKMPTTSRSSQKLNVPTASSARHMRLIRRDLNFVRANANAVSHGVTARRQSENSNLNANSGGTLWVRSERQKLGQIPPYLMRRRREEQAREADNARKAEEDSLASPPGHRRMSNDERLSTLQSLREARANALDDLNRMPLRANTIRVRTMRSELENRLSELESAINIFTKPVVYVKLD